MTTDSATGEDVIPRAYRGPWRRVSIAVGDGPAEEAQVVWWLQAAQDFVDLRLPRVPGGPDPVSFAGVTTYRPEPPTLWWRHQIALDGVDLGDDVGRVTWDGTDLLEEGTTVVDGEPVRYVERWRRLPPPLDGVERTRVLRGVDEAALMVEVGDHLLAVVDRRSQGGPYQSCGWRRTKASSWELALVLEPNGIELAPPPAEVLPPGAELVIGDLGWSVVEDALTPSIEVAP